MATTNFDISDTTAGMTESGRRSGRGRAVRCRPCVHRTTTRSRTQEQVEDDEELFGATEGAKAPSLEEPPSKITKLSTNPLKVRGCDENNIRAASKSALMSNLRDVLAVIVGSGEDAKTFLVHRDLIRSHSVFFRAACDGQWREAKNNEVHMPADSPAVFEQYLQWLYTGELATLPAVSGFDLSQYSTLPLINLYCLGDRIQDPSVKNVIVNRFMTRTESMQLKVLVGIHGELHENVPSNCGLLRLIMDTLARGYTASEFEQDKEAMPREILEDLTATLLKDRARPSKYSNPFTRRLGLLIHNNLLEEGATRPGAASPEHAASSQARAQCQYHEHDEEQNPLT